MSQSYAEDVSCILNCLTTASPESYPYRYWLLSNLFPEEMIDGLIDLPLQMHQLTYQAGFRDEHNSTRRYIDPTSIDHYPICQRVAAVFQNPQVIAQFEQMGDICLKNCLLHIEYAVDTQGFWLQPHTDMGMKLFTMLLYLSKDPNAASWGTNIYENMEKHVKAVPYKSNTALMFIPAENTWHGFEERPISGVRKTLIINYVTHEWPNRDELVHPNKPVY